MAATNETETDTHTTSQSRLIIALLSNAVTCAFVVVNNTLLMLTLARSPKLQTLTNAYMVSLGSADLIVGVVLFLRHFWLIPQTEWVFNDNKLVCLPVVCLMYISGTETICNLLWISVDRFVFVTRPLHYEQIITKGWIKWTIGLSWVFSICFGLLPMYMNDFSPELGCNAMIIVSGEYFMALITFFVLSGLVIAYMYGRIFSTFLQQNRRLLQETARTGQTYKGQSRWRVVRFFFLVCCLFYICWVPLVVTAGLSLGDLAPLTAISITVSIAGLNSALNFVVFLIMERDFRSAVLTLLCNNRRRGMTTVFPAQSSTRAVSSLRAVSSVKPVSSVRVVSSVAGNLE